MKGIKTTVTLRALSAKKLSNEHLLIYDATLIFFYDCGTEKNYGGITKVLIFSNSLDRALLLFSGSALNGLCYVLLLGRGPWEFALSFSLLLAHQ